MSERGFEQTRYVQAPMAVATQDYGLFINGESTEPASGELRDLTEPATGAPLARVAMAKEQDVDRAVEAARAALEGPWGKTPPTERSRLLHALAAACGAAGGRARRRGRLPSRRDQHRPRPRARRRRAPRSAPRCREDRVHGLDRDGERNHAPRLRRHQALDPRARRQEPEPDLR